MPIDGYIQHPPDCRASYAAQRFRSILNFCVRKVFLDSPAASAINKQQLITVMYNSSRAQDVCSRCVLRTKRISDCN